MSDAETILAMLKKIGVEARLAPADGSTDSRGERFIRVEEEGRQAPVLHGYGNGSFVDFEFDAAGNLVALGIWES